MNKKDENSNISIGVEIDKNKVIVTELTNGVVSDVISVTLDTLEESWKEATKNYKKYMKKNLFTVSVSNYFTVYNDVHLNYDTLNTGENFKNIVEMQNNMFIKEEIFTADIAEKNSVLPKSDSAVRSIVNGYNYEKLKDLMKILKNTRAQVVPTSILLGKLKKNILYTGFDNCFFLKNDSSKKHITVLQTGGVCSNIQNLCENKEENKAIDRFLDVIDGSIADMEALSTVATLIDNVAIEVNQLSQGARDSVVLTGILGANSEIRSSIESKGAKLDMSVYESSIWGEVPLNDRSEFLVSLLAATTKNYLPRYCLLAESDLLYSRETKKERKKNAKIHILGVTLVLTGLVAGFYPLFSTQNEIERAKEVNSRLETRLNETLDFKEYFTENKEELETLKNIDRTSYSYEIVKGLTENLPDGVTLAGFRYENSNNKPSIIINAYGFSSTSMLTSWVSSLENSDEVSQVWVDNYNNTDLSAQYSIGITLQSTNEYEDKEEEAGGGSE